MQLLPIHTPILRQGDDLAGIIRANADIQPGDMIVISSKAIATAEGAALDLTAIQPGADAEQWSKKTGRSAAFCEAVLHETQRLNGKTVGWCPGAMFSEVQPEGLATGSILIANAGLDESNIDIQYAVGWPVDPVASARVLRKNIQNCLTDTGNNPMVGVIITDSCCSPRRKGVIAFALSVSGFEPIRNEIGKKDLFQRTLRITTEAVADQLATAANFIMGNANQSVPAVIIRDHGVTLTEFEGWVPGIDREEDLFRGAV
ncbi:MAG: F420-0:gamma-glutamyl ligase [Candidatus Peribacteria bacterium]|nr:F420-0:gamma-glutamyl ligase [Candidatus Peribacteria bacterium]